MANYLLLSTSIIMAIIKLSTFIFIQPPLFFSILGLLAAFTSIWNHAVSQQLAKLIDRFYMVIYVLINAIIIYSVIQDPWHMLFIYFVMLTGIYCVLKAIIIRNNNSNHPDIKNPNKINKPGNYYHFYAHCVVMFIHVILSYKLEEDCIVTAIPVFCTDDWILMFTSSSELGRNIL